MPGPTLVIELLLYVALARFIVTRCRGGLRHGAFALLNGIGFYAFFALEGKTGAAAFIAYGVLAGVQYVLMRMFARREGWRPWLAFFVPILALIVIRYVPLSVYRELGGPFPVLLADRRASFMTDCFVGISYLAFRTSRLVLEVRNGSAPTPGFLEYYSFCFFIPTMSVGPINSYENFNRAFGAEPLNIPVGRSLIRILVGLVKYLYLAGLCGQMTYSGFLADDHFHPGYDLAIAMAMYYLYLYCNFSGFCDMAIGAAGLIGVHVPENFDNPFAARNIKDFWNRWHITLSLYMRDVVFSPLSKVLTRMVGPDRVNHAVALTIVTVFLLVGMWHGVGWHFGVFGAVHALGVVANHYYTIALKKWLGRDRFKAYVSNRWIRAVAVALTFAYVSMSLFFFANTWPEMKDIFSVIR